jgi:HEAT repeat protein
VIPPGWSIVAKPYNHGMHRASATTAVCWLLLATAWLACLPGCNSSGIRREHLASPYPLDRARAAVELAEAGDAQAIDLLIELLNDRDRGVRMYTILALERLCGETYGYKYYDPEPQRAAAVARWRQARQRGEVTVRARSARPHTTAAVAAAGANREEENPR